MGSGEDRWHCARCGANNFPTQSACWKCGSGQVSASHAPSPSTAGDVHPGSVVAAAILGLALPVVAFAAGLVFLMLGGSDRSRLGKAALAWSAAGAAAHILGTLLLAGVVGRLLFTPLTTLIQRAASPSLDSGADPKHLPGFE
ncbi:MAG: hypothetical protein ACKO5K_04235 [Armatimonadota bacterium]